MPHYKACKPVSEKQNAILLAIPAASPYIQDITARPGLLSVTESVALPPQPNGRSYVKNPRIQFS